MTRPVINLAEMSDEEITNMDHSKLDDSDTGKEDDTGSKLKDGDVTPPEGQSAADTNSKDDQSESTGGADSDEGSGEEDAGGADSTSADGDEGKGTADQSEDGKEQTGSSNQGETKGSAAAPDTGKASDEPDPKAELARLMAPLKAAKREIKINSPEDARRLMQMGVDYSKKMEAMKPHQRILKTLEKHGLLDESKLNLLIDMTKKNPEAIRKFLKDSEIDPMDLSGEGDTPYKPTVHMVGDQDVVLDEVLDDIRGTDSFNRTVDVITNEWDTASRRVLMDNPSVIRIINDHIAAGVYDIIANKVAQDRIFGRLTGLSDLEAYKAVGDAIQKEGGFDKLPNSNGSPANGKTSQDFSQDSGSGSANAENLRNRKRAASPTKGSASTVKPPINIMAMSDEDIMKLNVRSL